MPTKQFELSDLNSYSTKYLQMKSTYPYLIHTSKRLALVILFFSISTLASAQVFNFAPIANLNNEVAEISGILYLNGKLLAHTDSGGENIIYEINSTTGTIERRVTINNATNIDWEDICADERYIYIGDIGNNNGTRQNLTVYRILISDYENTANTSVDAETIYYEYQDQTNFSSSVAANKDYDAEALIAYNDSLYIFTKNWHTYECNIYSVAKIPNATAYKSKRIDSFNANGLITAADYNPANHDIILSAYNLSGGDLSPFSFVIKLSEFTGNNFSGGNIISREVPLALLQAPKIEGITFFEENKMFLSSEEVRTIVTLAPWLGALEWDGGDYPVQLENEILLSPNPAHSVLHYSGIGNVTLSIYNTNGQLLQQTNENTINISTLKKGLLLVRITNLNGKLISTQMVLKK